MCLPMCPKSSGTIDIKLVLQLLLGSEIGREGVWGWELPLWEEIYCCIWICYLQQACVNFVLQNINLKGPASDWNTPHILHPTLQIILYSREQNLEMCGTCWHPNKPVEWIKAPEETLKETLVLSSALHTAGVDLLPLLWISSFPLFSLLLFFLYSIFSSSSKQTKTNKNPTQQQHSAAKEFYHAIR